MLAVTVQRRLWAHHSLWPVGLPTASLAGPIFATWIALASCFAAQPACDATREECGRRGSVQQMPGFGISLVTVLIPVILMLLASAADIALDPGSSVRSVLHFVGHPIVALLLALLFSFWSLGRSRHFSRKSVEVLQRLPDPTATILLVIGAGGGFNQVLVQSGVGSAIATMARGSHASPLVLPGRRGTRTRGDRSAR